MCLLVYIAIEGLGFGQKQPYFPSLYYAKLTSCWQEVHLPRCQIIPLWLHTLIPSNHPLTTMKTMEVVAADTQSESTVSLLSAKFPLCVTLVSISLHSQCRICPDAFVARTQY